MFLYFYENYTNSLTILHESQSRTFVSGFAHNTYALADIAFPLQPLTLFIKVLPIYGQAAWHFLLKRILYKFIRLTINIDKTKTMAITGNTSTLK